MSAEPAAHAGSSDAAASGARSGIDPSPDRTPDPGPPWSDRHPRLARALALAGPPASFLPALLLEAQALATLLAAEHESTRIGPFLGWHLAASLACGWPFWRCLPQEMREPRRPLMTLGVMANVFVPLLSAGMVLALRIGLHLRRIARALPFATIAQPEFELHRKGEVSQMRNSRLRSRLMDPSTPMADRVTDLLSIQDVPSRITADIMRALLADRVEDIRLLAYGMLDGREKAISQRIFAQEAQLEHTGDIDRIFGAHKRLAELYWELVFQRLVDGDMRTHACKSAREQAERALVLRSDDAGVWFLLVRVLHTLKDFEGGKQALVIAEQHGFPRDRLVPWIAEYAFAERRFGDVRAAFAELPVAPGAMQLAAAWHYWTGR